MFNYFLRILSKNEKEFRPGGLKRRKTQTRSLFVYRLGNYLRFQTRKLFEPGLGNYHGQDLKLICPGLEITAISEKMHHGTWRLFCVPDLEMILCPTWKLLCVRCWYQFGTTLVPLWYLPLWYNTTSILFGYYFGIIQRSI